MTFSSITFLFFYLPLVLITYTFSPRILKNCTLLILSLLFYTWGEGLYVIVLIASMLINFFGGIHIAATPKKSWKRRFLFIAVVFLNIMGLFFFKYWTFLVENINYLLPAINLSKIDTQPIHLPIGISFYTFQSLSYIIDVYQKRIAPQKNIINLSMYISLFPQLIAGPIVRYSDIVEEIANRSTSLGSFSAGVQRFIFGLSKKILLANPLGLMADTIFSTPVEELSFATAWLGAACYTLQIYYDFSGYSDMAIGLGRMFGFTFPENFNYPYIAQSIREFWTRWHISLSSWLRDYLYIPLGGSRQGAVKTFRNLLIVFTLCGLWHGANWTFIVWGLYHGFFIIIERAGLEKIYQSTWPVIRIVIIWLIVMIGWVIFRSDTLSFALSYLACMMNFHEGLTLGGLDSQMVNSKLQTELAFAFLCMFPLKKQLGLLREKMTETWPNVIAGTIELTSEVVKTGVLAALLYFSVISLASGSYNPFIYFRF